MTHAPRWWRRATARIAVWSTTPAARRGTRLVHRYGPFAVTAAYLTFGIQTAVFAGAGLVRMPYLRFTIASIPGALAWAFVWATVGLGAVWGAVALAARSPWALAGILLVLTGAVVWWVRRRGSRRLPLEQVPTAPVGALSD